MDISNNNFWLAAIFFLILGTTFNRVAIEKYNADSIRCTKYSSDGSTCSKKVIEGEYIVAINTAAMQCSISYQPKNGEIEINHIGKQVGYIDSNNWICTTEANRSNLQFHAEMLGGKLKIGIRDLDGFVSNVNIDLIQSNGFIGTLRHYWNLFYFS